MPSALVPNEKLADWLGQDVVEDSNLLEPLIAAVETQFLKDATRTVPFQAAQAARVETHDAPLGATLYLDYSIGAITSVILGYDPSAPDETLDVNDRQVLIWSIGSRRLVRVDGGTFGGPRPGYVQVTYDAQADLPADAAMAVTRMAAAIYMQRGAEDVSQERIGGYDGELARLKDSDTVWRDAVDAARRLSV